MTTFAPLFVPKTLREAVSDAAWLRAMVEAEQALLRANGSTAVLEAGRFDVEVIAGQGRAVANPVEPLVRALREQTPDVHRGATSQDILDTAAMLVSMRAVALIVEELRGAGDACAELARLRLPAQLGGAAGTLAALGERGLQVKARFAEELGLIDPLLPWHTNRAPIAELAALLDQVAQAAAKIGLDVVLLAQAEVGEVREGPGGGSSTMPHKRNPARAVLARACARGVHAQVSLLTSGDYELQRAAGAWQAEWNSLSEALALTGGAAAAIRECLGHLEVDVERIRANMGEELYSERDALGLQGDYLGSAEAFVDAVLERWAG